jgi:serine/threonine protein kinase/DNA-binding CsgD family transcriptional regulator
MIGRKLRNRYLIHEHLGEGSTATVYKAFDERLNRAVAVKMLLPQVRDSTRTRFFQEATAAAQLNHPNIMSIYDVDEEKGRPFLVVEYVEGETLVAFIPTSPTTVVELGRQIALALHYAHEREVIHRDIKPANIKVTPQGHVKIMDLGLALPREAVRVTAHGMVIGTPAYLSPEQAQGHDLDHRTDIYSLGIVLYEMVTGQLPFNADDIGALLLQQVKQPPPPPRLISSEIPPALEAVILKTLEKSPARRYQSCGALAAALEASLAQAGADNQSGSGPAHSTWADTLQAPSPGTASRPQRRTLRVILADDHSLLRRSLSALLETREEFVVVAEAGDGETALQQTLSIQPDVLLLDLNMPRRGGLDILPEVRAGAPDVKVLVLTGREEEAYIVRALRAGAHGYILKSSDEIDLLEAISRVMRGELVLGRGVTEKVVGEMLSPHGTDDNALTSLEAQILLYIAAGYENDAIARRLNQPLTDIIEGLASAMNKIDARDRHAAALKALRRGAILLEDLHNLDAPPR